MPVLWEDTLSTHSLCRAVASDEEGREERRFFPGNSSQKNQLPAMTLCIQAWLGSKYQSGKTQVGGADLAHR